MNITHTVWHVFTHDPAQFLGYVHDAVDIHINGNSIIRMIIADLS